MPATGAHVEFTKGVCSELSLYIYIYMERQLPVISRVKSEARFQALTRFAGHLALCIHITYVTYNIIL